MDGSLIINNQRIKTGDSQSSINPTTLEALGEFSLATEKEIQQAIQAATSAFPAWRDLSTREKSKIFKNIKAVLLKRNQQVLDIIGKEKGTPLTEAWATELFSSLEVLDYYARNAGKTLKSQQTKPHVALFNHKKSEYLFQPLGPVLIISPWNYPFLIPMYDIMSALASGNTAILRPSTTTAFIALLLGEIFVEAGMPPGVLNIVNCKTQLAEVLLTSPDIQAIMFTGSTGIGKKIMALASQNLTNITLELGGKDPMIVSAKADLERAAKGAVWGAFTNTGQSCGSIERVYVDQSVAPEFIDKVLNCAQKIRVGDPFDTESDIGPMATLQQLEIVESHIQDAVNKGAKLLWGGERLTDLPGFFINPAVLTETNHTMDIMTEETFGPTLPIMTYTNPEEAVTLANDSQYGLTASVWTRDKAEAAWFAKNIQAGSVTINDHMTSFTEPGAIWGGIKQTGIGRSHGPYGMLELVNIKYTSYDFARKKSLLWWFPYTKLNQSLFKEASDLMHHRQLRTKARALFAIAPNLLEVNRKVPLINIIKSLPKILKQ